MQLVITKASQMLTLLGKKKGPRGSTCPRTKEGLKDLGPINDGYIAVDHGRIVEIGTGRPPAADTVIDASGMTVMPGFVDPHTHLVFAGSRENELGLKLEGRTYMEILKAGGGIQSTVRATRVASKALLKELAAFRCQLMLRHGTTTCEAKSGYGLDLDTEVKILDAISEVKTPMDIVPTFLGAHALPPEFARTPDYIDFIIKKVLPKVKGKARFCDVFCEDGAFTLEDSRRLLTAAKKAGLVPKIHADEIKNIGGSSLAAELGAISADHLLATTDKDLKAMAKASVIGVYLPATPFSLMMKDYPDVRQAIDHGVAVALATDFNPNAWTHSMPFIINLACYKMRMRRGHNGIDHKCRLGHRHAGPCRVARGRQAGGHRGDRPAKLPAHPLPLRHEPRGVHGEEGKDRLDGPGAWAESEVLTGFV